MLEQTVSDYRIVGKLGGGMSVVSEAVPGKLLIARNNDCAHAGDGQTKTAVPSTELGYFL